MAQEIQGQNYKEDRLNNKKNTMALCRKRMGTERTVQGFNVFFELFHYSNIRFNII